MSSTQGKEGEKDENLSKIIIIFKKVIVESWQAWREDHVKRLREEAAI